MAATSSRRISIFHRRQPDQPPERQCLVAEPAASRCGRHYHNPLLFFTAAATRLRLSTLGFFQYLGPTLMFILAVTFYGETIGNDKMVTFIFIWAALLLFTLDALYTQRKLRR